jgi:DinB superfamily
MTTIIELYLESTKALKRVLQGMESPIFTQKPEADAWSVAEVVEHLNISDKSAYLAMVRTTGLPEDEHLETSNRKVNLMINRENRKYVAPVTVEPKGIFKDSETGMAVFMKTRDRIAEFAQREDMELLATGLEHPRLGLLTRKQWLEFLTWHANHHRAQIEGILSRLGAK